jgi:uncharacterized alkaline shock family protein YloU
MTEIIEQEDDLQLYPTGSNLGSIQIHPDVIARITAMAVSEIEGVSLGSKFSLADILPSKEPVKGVHVIKTDSGRHSLEVEVKMAYRTPMRETAERLQRHVKDTIERMTGLELETVDIKIVDIYVEKKDKDKEREEE